MEILKYGVYMVLTFGLLYVLTGIILNRKNIGDFSEIKSKDNLILLLLAISFYSWSIIISINTEYSRFWIFFLISSFIGLFVEFTIGWIHYLIFNARIYRYYRHNIGGFTSIDTLPLWGAAAMLFLAIWQIIGAEQLEINSIQFFIHYLGYGFLSSFIVSGAVMLNRYFRKKHLDIKGYSIEKVAIFSAFAIGGSLGSVHEFGQSLGVYFLISAAIGVFLEGILGKSLRRVFGENLWIYNRFTLFGGATSWLIAPLWLTASAMAYTIFSYILL